MSEKTVDEKSETGGGSLFFAYFGSTRVPVCGKNKTHALEKLKLGKFGTPDKIRLVVNPNDRRAS